MRDLPHGSYQATIMVVRSHSCFGFGDSQDCSSSGHCPHEWRMRMKTVLALVTVPLDEGRGWSYTEGNVNIDYIKKKFSLFKHLNKVQKTTEQHKTKLQHNKWLGGQGHVLSLRLERSRACGSWVWRVGRKDGKRKGRPGGAARRSGAALMSGTQGSGRSPPSSAPDNQCGGSRRGDTGGETGAATEYCGGKPGKGVAYWRCGGAGTPRGSISVVGTIIAVSWDLLVGTERLSSSLKQ